ncbi:tryptophan-rich sensory protein [Afipia broomeae]|uniref:tryptophan-rich sensory protein n=1 Tax=Afipia broomeae TaxID=56946 RepID=UPI000684A7CD|nr:TspO/MBR family protein [Afipia broomeae]
MKVDTTVIVATTVTLLVLGIGGRMTTVGPWYENLVKPKWTPPNWAFGPAWTIILGLAAWSSVLAPTVFSFIADNRTSAALLKSKLASVALYSWGAVRSVSQRLFV